MRRFSLRDGWNAGAAVAAAGIVISAAACGSRDAPPRPGALFAASRDVAPTTSRDDLARTVAEASSRLATAPADTAAAVRLAEALLRQSRVAGDPSLGMRAEQVATRALAAGADDAPLRGVLAAVYLSQHRFADAARTAEHALVARPRDEALHGLLGDARLELGDYEQAFDAFDRMNALKPGAASYARASYARELQGDLAGALRLMRMALDATPPQDFESLAWHHAQVGFLCLADGRTTEAERAFAHAEAIFPSYPLATEGMARVAEARGQHGRAFTLLEPRLRGPLVLPADRAFAGDLLARLERHAEAEQQYRLAEAGWRADVPEPSLFARFLATHDRRLDEALTLGERAWRERQDIFTADALAWTHFRLGHLDQARVFIGEALRTGSRDRTIRAHAHAIAQGRAPAVAATTLGLHARSARAGR